MLFLPIPSLPKAGPLDGFVQLQPQFLTCSTDDLSPDLDTFNKTRLPTTQDYVAGVNKRRQLHSSHFVDLHPPLCSLDSPSPPYPWKLPYTGFPQYNTFYVPPRGYTASDDSCSPSPLSEIPTTSANNFNHHVCAALAALNHGYSPTIPELVRAQRGGSGAIPNRDHGVSVPGYQHHISCLTSANYALCKVRSLLLIFCMACLTYCQHDRGLKNRRILPTEVRALPETQTDVPCKHTHFS